MTVFPSESETDTTLEIPLQRFNIKVGRENEIANKVRQALVKNEYFALDENGTELYYEIYGRGEHKILFINASGRSLDDYRHLISRFLDLNQFQMCAYDHRTTGMSKGKLQRLSGDK
ncbi:MAG: hypothetical protein EZS28_011068 [Streblomastix strix]|uniref:Uncharacterized protein n=1 Tax=Streblomastix strix TaxID=222440 RepID=A0A5J4WEM4_9EUKA|nr:MAG: hypothetical protein EZS28_011068 [Streblomastix strix]